MDVKLGVLANESPVFADVVHTFLTYKIFISKPDESVGTKRFRASLRSTRRVVSGTGPPSLKVILRSGFESKTGQGGGGSRIRSLSLF